jgi:hypothetical protein
MGVRLIDVSHVLVAIVCNVNVMCPLPCATLGPTVHCCAADRRWMMHHASEPKRKKKMGFKKLFPACAIYTLWYQIYVDHGRISDWLL